MATKKEVFETTSKAVEALCTQFKTPAPFNEKLQAILADNLAPKTAGMTVNLDEVTRKDANGKITEIQCSVSGKWLPATKEYFYEEKAEGKGIVALDGSHLKRLSRQAESVRKQFIKAQQASEKAVMADVLSGDLTPDKAKEALEAIKAKKPDYSSVGLLKDSE